MFLSIATARMPATDWGHLLMKRPERVHECAKRFASESGMVKPHLHVDHQWAVFGGSAFTRGTPVGDGA